MFYKLCRCNIPANICFFNTFLFQVEQAISTSLATAVEDTALDTALQATPPETTALHLERLLTVLAVLALTAQHQLIPTVLYHRILTALHLDLHTSEALTSPGLEIQPSRPQRLTLTEHLNTWTVTEEQQLTDMG